MISKINNPEVIQFIQEHINHDPVELVLMAKKYPNLPIREIAIQIASRQKVKTKLPEWYANSNIIFPPKENLEQASSELTARFKSRWLKGDSIVDLTGGSGIDLFYMSENFEQVCYVEINSRLAEITTHNFELFGKKIESVNNSAENFIESNTLEFDVVYLDPSRRDINKNKVFGLEEYQPNVVELYSKLMELGKTVLIKTSPMIDIKQTLKLLPDTFKVQVVAVENEVKEVLFYLKSGFNEAPKIESWNISDSNKEQEFSFTFHQEKESRPQISSPKKYLYEPNPSIRKAGAFSEIAIRFGLIKLHPNTHLYTLDSIIEEFPGRIFVIEEVIKPNKKGIKKAFPSGKVNVISKNFPMGTNDIKKKYGLVDGGEEFLIFCESNGKIALKCELVKKVFEH